MSTDIRWRQRYANFQKALLLLENAINDFDDEEDDDNDIVYRAGIIQFYEMTFQLAWNTLQDILKDKGYDETIVSGPKPVIKQSFKDGYISDDAAWLDMLDSRNNISHTYNEEVAIEIADKIRNVYFRLLDDLDKRLAKELEIY